MKLYAYALIEPQFVLVYVVVVLLFAASGSWFCHAAYQLPTVNAAAA